MNEEGQNTARINFQSILLIVLLAIGVGIIFLLQAEDSKFDLSGSSKFQKGTPAPDFSLPNLEGTMVSLAQYTCRANGLLLQRVKIGSNINFFTC